MSTAVKSPASLRAPAPSRRDGLVRRAPGRLLGLAALVALLAVIALVSLAVGARSIAVADAWQAFTAFDPAVSDHLVVRTLRLPRTVIGLVVGAALGLSGAVMQGLTRNPLAEPGILGVNAGAALGVVLAINLLGVVSAVGWVAAAMAGALAASVFVYVLGSRGRGGATPVKLALAGAATAALLAAMTSAVVLLDQATLDQYRFWAVGSLTGRELDLLAGVAPFLAVGAVLSVALGRTLNALSLGDDVAMSLGQRVGPARLAGAVAVMLLVGGAVSLAGPIGFVGLVVPHVARAIVGPDYRWVVVYSAVIAAALLVGADVVGRVVARPGELQVGIVTAVVGAPFFVALVRRRRLAEL